MRRASYVGTAGVAGDGYPAIPIQIETQAYVARLSVAPSKTFKNALNQAIFRWKAAGLYTLIADLWLLSTDAKADCQRNLVTAARDGTLTTGGEVFTTLKGLNFAAGGSLALPWNGSVTNSFSPVFAGVVNTAAAVSSLVLGASGSWGSVIVDAGSPAQWGFAGPTSGPMFGSGQPGIEGVVGGSAVSPGGVSRSNGTQPALSGTGWTASSPALTRLCAVGWFNSSTAAQVRLFLSILAAFLDDVGALS